MEGPRRTQAPHTDGPHRCRRQKATIGGKQDHSGARPQVPIDGRAAASERDDVDCESARVTRRLPQPLDDQHVGRQHGRASWPDGVECSHRGLISTRNDVQRVEVLHASAIEGGLVFVNCRLKGDVVASREVHLPAAAADTHGHARRWDDRRRQERAASLVNSVGASSSSMLRWRTGRKWRGPRLGTSMVLSGALIWAVGNCAAPNEHGRGAFGLDASVPAVRRGAR